MRETVDILTFAIDPARKDILWKIYYKFGVKISRKAMAYAAEAGESIPAFFRKLRRMAEAMDGGPGNGSGNVVLSTVHGSKGLEYPRVIIMDAVQGILPARDSDEEEERRIFYVAVTRAMDSLVMMKYGDSETPFPDQALGIKKGGPIRITEAAIKEAGKFKAGSIVSHKSFGTGRIVSVDEDGRAKIDFGANGTKKMSLQACVAMGILKKKNGSDPDGVTI